MDLSLIIPVYNIENHIGPMLKSLKEQERGIYSVEILFVDNNNTDGTVDRIRAADLPNVRLLQCKEQGCGPARNVGLDAASGELIWMLDGDDYLLDPLAVRHAIKTAYRCEEDAIYVPYVSDNFNARYFSMVWQYVFRRDLLRSVRFSAVQPGEDDEFMMLLLPKLGKTIDTFDTLPRCLRPLYFYRYLREGSNMWKHFNEKRGE